MSFSPVGSPLVEGVHQLTPSFANTLDAPYERRIEDGVCVLSRVGITIWVDVPDDEPRASRIAWIRESHPPKAIVLRDEEDEYVNRYTYRIRDDIDGGGDDIVFDFVIADDAYLHVAVCSDGEAGEEAALAIAASARYTPYP